MFNDEPTPEEGSALPADASEDTAPEEEISSDESSGEADAPDAAE